MKGRIVCFTFFLCLFQLQGCNPGDNSGGEIPSGDQGGTAGPGGKLFQLLPAEKTGVDFRNDIREDAENNYFKFLYYYNGAGVGAGDFNNDGLTDLYFTSNMGSNRLYLNLGNLKFRDITGEAGVGGNGKWSNGVAIADVNGDGWLDMYVCQGGSYANPMDRANLLYINNGPDSLKRVTFTEMAREFRVADGTYTTHATFLDFDKDGDLDLFLVAHPNEFGAMIDYRLAKRNQPAPFESDRLYRNEDGKYFTDVTDQSGVLNYSYGLSATAADLNGDGWTDIYVANDFAEPDHLYINNRDGTFSDRIMEMTRHISQFGMGNDIADFNNDGLPDIVVMDMMAEDNKRKKTNMSGMQPEAFWFAVKAGLHHQYMQNTLQLNNGNGTFSDIADLAGVANTDWSWAPLLVDLDNDGWKDLFVTNGYRRDARDNDFVNKVKKLGQDAIVRNFRESLQLMPENKLDNYAFRNGKDLRFSKKTDEWGLAGKSFSNGATYADLDGDGDVELIVNNLNDVAFIFENTASQNPGNHFLRIRLQGTSLNRQGIGAKVTVRTPSGSQYQEMTLSRGYMSSIEPILHFGLGAHQKADAVEILWPDGSMQILRDVPANQTLILDRTMATGRQEPEKPVQPVFSEQSGRRGIEFTHTETEFNDYGRELLLPHKQSQNGPFISGGDVNADGLEDFFIGGGAGQAGALFIQTTGGSFRKTYEGFTADAACEDMGSAFFDADGDKDLDLYVVSGSNEFAEGSELYQDRLYLNDGKGNFRKAGGALPEIRTSGSCVRPCDFDGDGDTDLFVGGRIVPGKYPFPARSYLLQNEGGKFSDVTKIKAPDLLQPGLVTAAEWTGLDGDKKPDLIVAGEWMPVSLYQNDGQQLRPMTGIKGLEGSRGLWFSLQAADFDKDGDQDFILGNLGENTKFKASANEPFRIYSHDFDQNGTLDIVLGYYNQGECYPVRGRTCSSQQMPFIQSKYPTYEQFGSAKLEDIYGDKLNEALHYEATFLQSAYLENKGGGQFELRALPAEAQFSTVMGMGAMDFDGDGHTDLVLAGNHWTTEVETCRHDASIGLFLRGDGNGGFVPVKVMESGFFAWGDVKDVKVIRLAGGKPLVLVSQNGGKLLAFATP